MRFRFKKKKLEELYTTEKSAHKFPTEVIDAFFEAMAVIATAHDERDLYALKGFHFEKLSGDRKGEHSLRLNKQFRLIITIEKDADGKFVLVIDIERITIEKGSIDGKDTPAVPGNSTRADTDKGTRGPWLDPERPGPDHGPASAGNQRNSQGNQADHP